MLHFDMLYYNVPYMSYYNILEHAILYKQKTITKVHYNGLSVVLSLIQGNRPSSHP